MSLRLIPLTECDRLTTGYQLSVAYNSNAARIARDFPAAPGRYGTAQLASATVAKRRDEADADYQAYAIAWGSSPFVVVGVASIARELLQRGGKVLADGLQFAFWMASRELRQEIGCGLPLLPDLLTLVGYTATEFNADPTLWTVVRPEHSHMRTQLFGAGYNQVGIATDYSSVDNVTVPRILYVKGNQ